MLIKIILNEHYKKDLTAMKRYDHLLKEVEKGHTVITEMKLIDEKGEILNEYKRLY